jgi:hypothetical protein
MCEFAKSQYECSVEVLIEDCGSGTQLIQTLKREFRICPISIKPDYDKATRLQSVSHLIENGTCLFPDNNPPWWHEFEQELLRQTRRPVRRTEPGAGEQTTCLKYAHGPNVAKKDYEFLKDQGLSEEFQRHNPGRITFKGVPGD